MANTPSVRKRPSKPVASGAGRPTTHLRPQNRKSLKWHDSWLATPDDRGEKLWNGFEDDLRNQRTNFRPTQTG